MSKNIITSNKLLLFIIGVIIVLGLMGLFSYSGNAMLIWINVCAISLIYYYILKQIHLSGDYKTLLCDGRFYFFTILLAYTIVTPIYGVLSNVDVNGVKVRTSYFALTYTSKELLLTTQMSLLLFIGIFIGVLIRNNTSHRELKNHLFSFNEENLPDDVIKKKIIGWLIITIISAAFYIKPFVNGGFSIIRYGGTYLDIDIVQNSKLVDVLFSPEIMVVGGVSIIYYIFESKRDIRVKMTAMIIIDVLFVLFAVFSTRRARAFAIILSSSVIYTNWSVEKKKKFPKALYIVIFGVFILFYFLEIITQVRVGTSTIASTLFLFDGVPAYDSLLLAARENVTSGMIINVIYGLFRHIPFFGKYIVSALGIDNTAPPLYKWMAARYSTYSTGGGLAYTPQLEAYLTAGLIGCLLFGIIYGLIFGKERHGLRNYIVIAISFSIARGNLQVLLSLLWPYVIIGYVFYDCILLRRVKLFKK